MGHHHHGHGDHHGHAHGSSAKNITLALILNALFVVVEVVGGVATNSIAILSDALHDLGDVLSLSIALYLQRKSKQASNLEYTYGYKRFSLLGSIFLSGGLLVSSLFIIVKAIGRVISPQAVDAHGMIWIAIFGVVINGAAALRLQKGNSLNERAVYIHMMEDILGWIGVLIISIVMRFRDIPILDPILSIIISIWVLYNVYKTLRATFKILLQAAPSSISIAQIESEIAQIEGVISLHNIHIWSQDGQSHVMTIHVVTAAADSRPIMTKIVELAQQYGIEHTTVQFEAPEYKCINA